MSNLSSRSDEWFYYCIGLKLLYGKNDQEYYFFYILDNLIYNARSDNTL